MKKRSIIAMLVLMFITCGLYALFWMYLARAEFKDFSGDSNIHPGVELLFSLICFPYSFYWLYKFSDDIAKYQAKCGCPVSNNAVINLGLAVFGFFPVSMLLIQDQLNSLADSAGNF